MILSVRTLRSVLAHLFLAKAKKTLILDLDETLTHTCEAN